MPVYHPYFGDLVCLMHLDGDPTDYSPLGQAFDNSGCTFSGNNGEFNAGADINGTNPGGGGSNRIQSSSARLEYDPNAGDLTLECWVTPASTASNGAGSRAAISLTKPGSGVGMSLSVYGNGTGTFARLDYEISAGVASLGSAAPAYLTTGVRYHLAATRKDDTYRLFLNGTRVAQGTDSSRGVVTARKLTVGNINGISQAFHGQVDEVAVCRRCLWTTSFTPPDGPYANFWPASCQAWPGGMA